MSDRPVLGIDLGTTNSVVAVADSQRVHVLSDSEGASLTPSTVSFHPSGSVLVGHPAVERRLVDADNTIFSIKRLLGRPFRSPEVARASERFAFELAEGPRGRAVVRVRGEQYALPEISAFVLRRLKVIAEEALGSSPRQAVVTVPANFNDLQRAATRDAARIAGLEVVRILNEPTAAALAHGHAERSDKRIAVYDLGGGTFDVSILDMSGDVIEVVATAGDMFLGGDDVDRAVADAMAEEFLRKHRIDLRVDPQAYERLRMAAEWLKCELSDQAQAQATLEQLGFEPGGRAIDFTYDLSRQRLESLSFSLLGRTFDICGEALKVAGLRPTQLDGVVLVGGQTRSPQVRKMVAEYFGRAPVGSLDPDRVVAQGAALQALSLSGQALSTPIQVAVPKAATSRSAYPPRGSTKPPPMETLPGHRAPPHTPPPPAGAPPSDPPEGLPAVLLADEEDDEVTEVTNAPVGSGIPKDSDFASDGLTPTAVADVRALVAASQGSPPLLLDVTPHTLAVETAGGYCEELVPRSAPIPTEQSRVFSTSQDDQVVVRMRVCQGEARRTDDNEVLGELELVDLPKGHRGRVQIEVTFVLDADGMLQARARDRESGQVQEVRVNLVGALSESEVAHFRRRQERHG